MKFSTNSSVEMESNSVNFTRSNFKNFIKNRGTRIFNKNMPEF